MLRCDLKASSEVQAPAVADRSFHSLGAAFWKARSSAMTWRVAVLKSSIRLALIQYIHKLNQASKLLKT